MNKRKQLTQLEQRSISLRIFYNVFSAIFGIFFLISFVFVFINFRPSGDEGRHAFIVFLIFSSFSFMARFFKWEKKIIQNTLDNEINQRLPVGVKQYIAILITFLHFLLGCYPLILMIMHQDEFSGELFIPLIFSILLLICIALATRYFNQRLHY